MEYVQETITTLHGLTGEVPDAPVGRAAVVVPMTEREYAGLAAERVLSELSAADPAHVVVALRAAPDRVGQFREWLSGFDLPLSVLWCNGPGVEAALADHGLSGDAGKGRDVWLALAVAAEAGDDAVVRDADAQAYSRADLARLLWPVAADFTFAKGYYARVEHGQLYGRLCRLFYEPIVGALSERHDAPILDFLGAFRYALAGEVAMTADLARRVRVPRRWGLEVGMLGDAFEHAGFEGTAQVDLGTHEHDHRAVDGPSGLSDMSRHVGATLLAVIENHGVRPDYASLPGAYRETARTMIRQYAADAAINGLEYDRADEREQVSTYAEAIRPPRADTRLPAWVDAPLSADDVRAASQSDVLDVRSRV
jgi:glucosyl-3-phosphoglycerate synthase